MEKVTEKTRRAVAGAQKPQTESKLDQLAKEHQLEPDLDNPGKHREAYDRQTAKELSPTLDPLRTK